MSGHAGDAKRRMRDEARRRLTAIGAGDSRRWSEAICRRLLEDPVLSGVDLAMFYIPMAREVDVRAAMLGRLEQGLGVCVPRVDWSTGTMSAARIDSAEQLSACGWVGPEDGRMARAPQPPESAKAVQIERIGAIVVPGLAFDRSGGRLGRGGGFYDRFLSRIGAGTIAVGAAFEAQVVERVPMGDADVRLDALATEAGLIRVGRDGRYTSRTQGERR